MALIFCFSMLPAAALEENMASQDSASAGDVGVGGEDTEPADSDVPDSESDAAISEVQTLADSLPDESAADNVYAAAEQENAPAAFVANAEDMPGGEGTVESPYLIGTLSELKWFCDICA